MANETWERLTCAAREMNPAVNRSGCGKLHAYSYTDPDHGDNPPGARVQQCEKWAKES